MVRLKDIGSLQIESIMRFQFLMVRLKEKTKTLSCSFIGISIPYGSIKSYCPSVFRIIFYISIPYGSIKSCLSFLILKIHHKFQFLMVRLKDVTKVCLKMRTIFQFLMVRLKGNTSQKNK